jgi:hypothetical protein
VYTDPFAMSFNEELFESIKAGTTTHRSFLTYYTKGLPSDSKWILEAKGDEDKFKQLVSSGHVANQRAEKKGLPPAATIQQEATIWQDRWLSARRTEEQRTQMPLNN